MSIIHMENYDFFSLKTIWRYAVLETIEQIVYNYIHLDNKSKDYLFININSMGML
jgi:hypothetical protein